eukprot:PhM_4_TR10027/c3_g1_i8/m.94850
MSNKLRMIIILVALAAVMLWSVSTGGQDKENASDSIQASPAASRKMTTNPPTETTSTPRSPSIFNEPLVGSRYNSHLLVALHNPLTSVKEVPIEAIDIRSARRLKKGGGGKGSSAKLKGHRVLLPSLGAVPNETKMYYLDLGARIYQGGSYQWFLKHYPQFNTRFEQHILMDVLDLVHTYPKTQLPKMKFIRAAAWTHDRGVMIKGYKMGRVAEGEGMAHLKGRDNRPEWKSDSVDMAAYLKRLARVEDFVVMKLDIEGGEWELLEHLYRTGALFLIDELFLECHSREVVITLDTPLPQDCVDMINRLRTLGVYTHGWY